MLGFRTMSGRDLLSKPQVIPQLEEETKPGAKKKARELGNVGSALPERMPSAETSPSVAKQTPAYKAAYFNKDSSGVKDVNLRQRGAAALRGGEGVTDLKKIVIPPSPLGIESPEPARLRGAGDLMGLDGSYELNLEALLGRQSAWAKQKTVTVEMIKAKQQELERMVASRKQALARMKKRKAASVTVDLAESAQGKGLDEVEDVSAAGRELVGKTALQADGMHGRIAKMLGIKRKT
jgi:hypothetical protein